MSEAAHFHSSNMLLWQEMGRKMNPMNQATTLLTMIVMLASSMPTPLYPVITPSRTVTLMSLNRFNELMTVPTLTVDNVTHYNFSLC